MKYHIALNQDRVISIMSFLNNKIGGVVNFYSQSIIIVHSEKLQNGKCLQYLKGSLSPNTPKLAG